MNGGTIIVIIVGVVMAIIAYASYSSDQKRNAEENGKKYGRMKRRIDAYHDYLIKECGYELPYVRNEPMAEEFDTMEYMRVFGEYEEEHKKLGLKASAEIDHLTYDIRESEVNKLKIENDDIHHKLSDLEMQGFYIRRFLDDLYEKHPKILDSTWKKFAKKYEIEGVIPEWYYISLDGTMSDEVDDVDEMVKRAKKRGKPITDERVKELKERAKLQEKQNKLYEDFVEYKKHELCSDRRCDEGWDTKKCKALRKKFDKYEEEYDEYGLPF